MPRSSLPPTPASSSDIRGKECPRLPTEKMSFALPPPAIATAGGNGAQPSQQIASSDFSLPPPPTRSRKIIQMKPKSQQTEEASSTAAQHTTKGSNKRGASGSSATSAPASKKQPSATSVAGKKIARKTAHSVIERRRRSKMNEEFSVLKDMIPACKDQEMHKLAILQASIDYLRYLEQCITDLKAANNTMSNPAMQPQAPPFRLNSFKSNPEENDDDDGDEDLDMENSESTSIFPAFSAVQRRVNPYKSPLSATASPALTAFPNQAASSYASSMSTLPSPAFGPQHHYQGHRTQYSHSASTSPTLLPEAMKEQDQEATAALLMLNKDRRNPSSSSTSGRSMSVKDLLSC